MSFPRYPKYKDSGVEWLGQVPEHWEVTALKRVVNPERQITYGIVQAGPHVPDGIPYIRPADMTDEHGVVNHDEVMRTSPEIASGYSRSTIRSGDVVCSIGPSFGKAMITPEWLDGANLTQGTARIAVQPPNASHYIFWTLRSPFSVAQWESAVGGATFRALNLAPLAETTILVPTPTEQTAIAAFLDGETAKIDGLVAEQQRLMELLKEKRQAVISHTVTQGLNPHAPMKPSGIEWLGDVPAHWDLRATKRLFRLVVDPAPDDNHYELLSIYTEIGVRPRKELEAKGNKATTTDGYWKVQKGDLIVNKLLAWMGAIGISDYDGVTSPAYDILRKRVPMEPRYYDFLFRCGICFSEFRRYSRGIMDMRLRLYFDELGQLVMPYPPESEQQEIVGFIQQELARFDALSAEAQRAIDLLQERRTALISAAVTGQIDVRANVASAQAKRVVSVGT